MAVGVVLKHRNAPGNGDNPGGCICGQEAGRCLEGSPVIHPGIWLLSGRRSLYKAESGRVRTGEQQPLRMMHLLCLLALSALFKDRSKMLFKKSFDCAVPFPLETQAAGSAQLAQRVTHPTVPRQF